MVPSTRVLSHGHEYGCTSDPWERGGAAGIAGHPGALDWDGGGPGQGLGPKWGLGKEGRGPGCEGIVACDVPSPRPHDGHGLRLVIVVLSGQRGRLEVRVADRGEDRDDHADQGEHAGVGETQQDRHVGQRTGKTRARC
jgi:hypothetical protein